MLTRYLKISIIFLSLVFVPLNSWAKIAYVNQVSNYDGVTGIGSLTTGTLSTIAGNLLIVVASYLSTSTTVTSVKDTTGNTYHQCKGCAANSNTDATEDLWYAYNIKSSSVNNATVTFSGSTANYVTVVQLQYSGVYSYNPFEVGAKGTAIGTSVTTASFSPSQPGGLNVAAYCIAGGPSPTASAGYTTRTTGSVQDRINAPSGSQTASVSWSGSQDGVIGVASFAPAVSTINKSTLNKETIN